ncbi:MAG: stage II sporulation protein P [Butyricicoccus pullicaecorum]|nr:stage II sporulation protein P [Butyricicoccus pullicaecorum]MDO4668977.1 stage II sporulation protein P [Butyricicoccus pullicaecorum]
MSRRPARKHHSGILIPATVLLLCAVGLLISHRMGGDAHVDALLDAIAQNQTFIASSIALETGIPARSRTKNTEPAPPASDSPEPTMESAPPPQSDTPAPPPAQDKRDTNIEVRNDAGIPIDVNAMLKNPIPIHVKQNEKPQVLIYHTHATEAYTPSGKDTYQPSGEYRTRDRNQNVVRVGTELAKTLRARGIGVLHITDIFDDPAYNGSYERSLSAAQKALKKYPDIKVTIDLHRDAILTKDGKQLRLATTIGGQEAAQLMLVVGTDASGLEHPNWRDNMNFAVNLQADANGAYPNLMRDVNLRSQRFNTHLRSGSLLLECGSSGNTLQEAIRSVQMFGEVLADRLLA